MSWPEHLMPPECFYDETNALKYTKCSRIIKIQKEMTLRCLELIGIPYNRTNNIISEQSSSLEDNDNSENSI